MYLFVLHAGSSECGFNLPKLFQYGILPQPPRGLLYMQTMGIEAMLKDYKAGSYNLEAAKKN